ncbi:hypothetical protein DL96DRAFT_1708315 [Flagelloscypha sp. PMI_526]|nr:hypothetical protein DL96DRAFT_1708315 [Flagelloscypha sp. PMI_526]
MSDDLPIDWDDPRVKDYLSLIRLQVLTPLSLLINIFVACVCAVFVSPSMAQVEKLYPTAISPHPGSIAVYVVALWVTQLGYCILLLFARKRETKETITKGVGLPLVLSNWLVAGFCIAWIFKLFIVTTIIAGIILVLLIYSNVNLLIYHAPTWSRPLDVAFIHTPMRFFLVLPLQVVFALSLFITLGLTYKLNEDGTPRDYEDDGWAGFGVLFGTNVLSLIVVVIRKDLVWCLASAWLCAGIWARHYVPKSVYVTAILFTFIHPLALIVATVWHWMQNRRRKQDIALEGDDSSQLHHNHHHESTPPYNHRPHEENHNENRGPREVDAQAVWG